MMQRSVFWPVLAVLAALPVLSATDKLSTDLALKAAEQEKYHEWYEAAKLYDQAAFEAESPQLKLNSYVGQAEALHRAGMYYKESEVIEKILKKFPTQCDFAYWTDREFDLALAFLKGYRDPAFWKLRSIPWLTDKDRSEEVGEKALKHAPFAKKAAELRLSLALHYDKEGKTDDAIRQLRALVKDHPEAKEHKYALLGLAEMLFFRSKRGDGDGRRNREAMAAFDDFRKHYPDATEIPYVERCILESKDIQAERMLGIARFYRRTGRKEAAQQYLHTVLQEYPDSQSAADSEELLVKMDKDYVPEEFLPEVKPRLTPLPRRGIPKEDKILLIAPENSNGKYLLPVYDLGLERNKEEQK